jgi:hypothetical protein
MTFPTMAAVVALVLQIAVVAALVQHLLAKRADRRELDRYLRWLIDEAARPIIVLSAGRKRVGAPATRAGARRAPRWPQVGGCTSAGVDTQAGVDLGGDVHVGQVVERLVDA